MATLVLGTTRALARPLKTLRCSSFRGEGRSLAVGDVNDFKVLAYNTCPSLPTWKLGPYSHTMSGALEVGEQASLFLSGRNINICLVL